MVRIPTHRAPTHPGEMLKEAFLIPMQITQRELADSIQTNPQAKQKNERIELIILELTNR